METSAKLAPSMLPVTKRCSVHEQRPAFARCMSCAKMLCQECATQWDGIWHCAACLGSKRGASVQRSPVFGWIAVVTLALFMLFAGARVMVWTAAILAELF